MQIVLDATIQQFKVIAMREQTRADRMRRPISSRALSVCALLLGVAAALLFDAADARAAGVACSWAPRGSNKLATIEVRNRSIKEALDCLTQKFDLHYRSGADLTLPITGTYEGSLNRILSRLLQGYNFVLKYSSEGVELTILGPGQNPPQSKVETKEDQKDPSAAEPEFGG